MATISSSIELYDNFSNVMYQIVNAVNLGLSSVEDFQQSMDSSVDVSSIEAARNSMNQAAVAAQALDAALHKIEPPAEPVEIPVEWHSDKFEVFTNSGIDRYEQEIAGVNSSLQNLISVQSDISNRAAGMDILPPQAVTDIESLSSRIQTLKTNIEEIEQNSFDIGSDEANTQLEHMRMQLLQLSEYQDNLNSAMSSMDISNINDAYIRLSQNVSNIEREVRDSFKEPVEIPIVWNSPTLEVFTNTGIERYEQEIQSVNHMLNTLNNTQQTIIQTASSTNLFPANAITDITNMQGRLQAIQQKIDLIESNPLNMGTDEANAELERMRGLLDQAIRQQEEMNAAVERMDVRAANEAYLRLSNIVDNTEIYLRENIDAQGQFNNLIQQGADNAAGLQSMIQRAISTFAGVASVRTAVDFMRSSMDLFDTQLNAENQLAAVLGNTLEKDVGGAFDTIKAKASEIQGRGIYGDEAMIAGAGELATYFTDTDAITSMMDTLANYTMGMTGGGEVGVEEMVNYATNLGKIMSGAYDAMTKKGFDFTDAQKAIIEGSATEAQYIEALGAEYVDMSEDMRAATVITQIIDESWADLYETMSNTPQGQIIQMTNSWGDMREEVGQRLYPAVINFVDIINNNWSSISNVVDAITNALQVMLGVLSYVLEGAINVADFIVSNWSMIGPVIGGIVSALAIYYGWQKAIIILEKISNGLHIAMAAAQMIHAAATGTLTAAEAANIAAQNGLNAALYACPITWIIIAIIALIAIFYAAIGAVNKFAGTSISATGVICGAFMVAAAFTGNLFVNLINSVIDNFVILQNFIADIANFFANVFIDPVAATKRLFYDLANTVLGILQSMASAIDTIFGSNLSSAVQGWRNNITDLAEQKYGNRIEVMEKLNASDLHLNRFEYGKAWNSGYSFGENLGNSFSGLNASDLFNTNIPEISNPASSLSPYNGIANNLNDIAGDTANIADNLSDNKEDLELLREIAERRAINKFTTAEVKVEFGGITNNINSDRDVDGFVDAVKERLEESLAIAEEGVHIA